MPEVRPIDDEDVQTKRPKFNVQFVKRKWQRKKSARLHVA